jgi:hypothetical protein
MEIRHSEYTQCVQGELDKILQKAERLRAEGRGEDRISSVGGVRDIENVGRHIS